MKIEVGRKEKQKIDRCDPLIVFYYKFISWTLPVMLEEGNISTWKRMFRIDQIKLPKDLGVACVKYIR